MTVYRSVVGTRGGQRYPIHRENSRAPPQHPPTTRRKSRSRRPQIPPNADSHPETMLMICPHSQLALPHPRQFQILKNIHRHASPPQRRPQSPPLYLSRPCTTPHQPAAKSANIQSLFRRRSVIEFTLGHLRHVNRAPTGSFPSSAPRLVTKEITVCGCIPEFARTFLSGSYRLSPAAHPAMPPPFFQEPRFCACLPPRMRCACREYSANGKLQQLDQFLSAAVRLFELQILCQFARQCPASLFQRFFCSTGPQAATTSLIKAGNHNRAPVSSFIPASNLDNSIALDSAPSFHSARLCRRANSRPYVVMLSPKTPAVAKKYQRPPRSDAPVHPR